jgi:hypothetical protein
MEIQQFSLNDQFNQKSIMSIRILICFLFIIQSEGSTVKNDFEEKLEHKSTTPENFLLINISSLNKTLIGYENIFKFFNHELRRLQGEIVRMGFNLQKELRHLQNDQEIEARKFRDDILGGVAKFDKDLKSLAEGAKEIIGGISDKILTDFNPLKMFDAKNLTNV